MLRILFWVFIGLLLSRLLARLLLNYRSKAAQPGTQPGEKVRHSTYDSVQTLYLCDQCKSYGTASDQHISGNTRYCQSCYERSLDARQEPAKDQEDSKPQPHLPEPERK